MDEHELRNLFNNSHVTRKYFGGILAQDELPELSVQHLPSFYIVNTDVTQGEGLHWTAIFIPNKQPLEFFDSLAKLPSAYGENFTDFLTENRHYLISNKQIQSDVSTACGQFCVFYAFYRCLNFSFSEILDKFSDVNLLMNDIKVRKFVHKLQVKQQG